VATGTRPRDLGLPDEGRLVGRGVSYCATCDGFFFKGREVFVVGGGNAAVYEALHLSTVCSKVVLVHRRDSLRAEKIRQEQLFNAPNVSVIWDSKVSGIIEDGGKVAGVRVENVKTGKSAEYPASALFVAIGHEPNTAIFNGGLELDPAGYVATAPDSTAASVEGVFAAGDVRNPRFRQVVIAAAEGAKAAMEAADFLLRPAA
jgi:thioredoxin reductase (NADPH)